MKTVSSITTKKLSRVAAGALVGLVGLTSSIGLALAQATPPSQTSEDSQMSQGMDRRMTRVSFIGLGPNNVLVPFNSNPRGSSKPIRVKGIDGNLQGIDFRPANGQLYGVTDTDKIYTINPNTGTAKLVRSLSTSFDGGFQSGADFNPALDRLRLVGSNDQNFSVNVDVDPSVTVQTTLAYIAGDPNVGKNPNITGAAYTNSQAGPPSPPGVTPPTRTTQLYDIDYDLDILVLQDPPNGTLTTVGKGLGVNFAPIVGFDILTDAKGTNTGFAVSGPNLYTIDLTNGTAKRIGEAPRGDFIGLAVVPAR